MTTVVVASRWRQRTALALVILVGVPNLYLLSLMASLLSGELHLKCEQVQSGPIAGEWVCEGGRGLLVAGLAVVVAYCVCVGAGVAAILAESAARAARSAALPGVAAVLISFLALGERPDGATIDWATPMLGATLSFLAAAVVVLVSSRSGSRVWRALGLLAAGALLVVAVGFQLYIVGFAVLALALLAAAAVLDVPVRHSQRRRPPRPVRESAYDDVSDW